MLAIIGFMPSHGNGAIGSLDYTPEERKVLAKRYLILVECKFIIFQYFLLKLIIQISLKLIYNDHYAHVIL